MCPPCVPGLNSPASRHEREAIAVEGGAGEVGGLGEAVGEVADRIDTAAEPVGHGHGLAAEGGAAIDGRIVGAGPHEEPYPGEVQRGGGEEIPPAVGAAGQPPHEADGGGTVVVGPAFVGIGGEDVDPARQAADLAR